MLIMGVIEDKSSGESALVQEMVWYPADTQALWSRDAYMCQ